jgi:hypothetical protein
MMRVLWRELFVLVDNIFVCVKNHLTSLIKYSDILQSALVWNLRIGRDYDQLP